MRDLPDRPDPDQLRSQARELLRAARTGAGTVFDPRFPFGTSESLEVRGGALFPEVLIIGSDRGLLRATMEYAHPGTDPALDDIIRLIDELSVTDDRGVTYRLAPRSVSGPHRQPGHAIVTARLGLALEPVPGHRAGWFDLRCGQGPATRLLPSSRAGVRIGPPAAWSDALTRSERELSIRAVGLILPRLNGDGSDSDDLLRRRCSRALARAAQLQQSGELGAASPLPDQLAQLCSVLTDRLPATGLRADWESMLHAADQADGHRYSCEIAASLPSIDGVTVHIDSLTSRPDTWRMHLRARPGWWKYSADGRRKRDAVSIEVRDDLGGAYAHTFDGSSANRAVEEELALRFLPRLDPNARTLTLTVHGVDTETSMHLDLKPDPQRCSS